MGNSVDGHSGTIKNTEFLPQKEPFVDPPRVIDQQSGELPLHNVPVPDVSCVLCLCGVFGVPGPCLFLLQVKSEQMAFYTGDKQLAYCDDDDELHFPVIFLYDEYEQSDFIQDLPEVHDIFVLADRADAAPGKINDCSARDRFFRWWSGTGLYTSVHRLRGVCLRAVQQY